MFFFVISDKCTFKSEGEDNRGGKISIYPYPPIDNVLFVKGLTHYLLSIIQLCAIDLMFPLAKMDVSSNPKIRPNFSLLIGKVIFIRLILVNYQIKM